MRWIYDVAMTFRQSDFMLIYCWDLNIKGYTSATNWKCEDNND